ncbi:MAG: hypothetical protein ACKE5M_06020 [Methylophilaceae bacterium]
MFFTSIFTHASYQLADSAFEVMCEGGKVLEQDERGTKVIQLTNGNIIKVFRLRSLISGARIYSYARRFCRNAIRLEAHGINTVKVIKLYHFEGNSNTAVLYEPLAGETLRDVVKNNSVTAEFVEALAVFLSKLHKIGVHFHSLHTGNVVLTPDGALGLIDISDLSIYPWPLFCNTRVRSFKRLCKYQEDIKQFGLAYWQLFQGRYFAESRISKACENKIRDANNQLIVFDKKYKADMNAKV